MNADRLLEHFERISDAADAVPWLRRFVLDLAVRGKLVAQDATNETADSILQLVSDLGPTRQARGRKASVDSDSTGMNAHRPHALPSTWKWVTLGDLFNYDAGIKREPRKLDPELWLLELEDIEKDTSRIITRLKVRERDSQSTKSEFLPGDILYGKLRPYLNKVVVADQPGYSTTEIVAIRPKVPMNAEYCRVALQRPDFVRYVERLGRGTKMPRLRTPDALAAPFPLPPLAEQHRIVAKVDELMALCDRLEAAQVEREARRDRLVSASLARVTEPDGADAASTATSARFRLDHFACLTTRPEHVKQLRQTILDLAVRGRLVSRNPHDETASLLIKEIKSDASDSRKRPNSGPPEPVPTHHSLPAGWAAVTLGEITRIRTGKLDANAAVVDGRYPFFTCSQTPLRIDSFSFDTAAVLLAGNGDFNLKSYTGKFDAYQRTYVIEPIRWNLNYCFIVLRAQISEITCNQRGSAIPYLKLGDITNLPVLLPPLAEQRRIVAKVDELMALCDQLEASLASAATGQARLLEALLHEALEPAA